MSNNPTSDTSLSNNMVVPSDTEWKEEYLGKLILTVDMSIIRRIAAYILLVGVYGFAWLVAIFSRMIPRRPWRPTGRIIVTGTFHNPNWYLSHVTPLSLSGVKEVLLVVDEPQLPLEKVRFVCPPKWISRLLSRAGAKAIWMIIAGIRYRPDLYMGYHILPGACSALLSGKLLGRPSCYQMTGGPIEIIGGGFAAVDSIEGSLGRPSDFIEKMAIEVVRQFDLVIVRGKKAKKFVTDQGLKGSTAIITGSVNGYPRLSKNDRMTHLVFVGRLTPVKQIDQFIRIVRAISNFMPSVKAAIVGDGPLVTEMKAMTNQLELKDNIEFLGKIEDVRAVLVCSRIFVLTSKSEGLSISVAEAMAAGVVPVVACVGELSDLVVDGVNGYLIEPNNIREYAEKIMSLLQDNALWARYSHKAIEAAKNHCHIDMVARKWRHCIRDTIAKASDYCH